MVIMKNNTKEVVEGNGGTSMIEMAEVGGGSVGLAFSGEVGSSHGKWSQHVCGDLLHECGAWKQNQHGRLSQNGCVWWW